MASKQDNYLRMHHPSIFKKMKKGGKVEEYEDGGLLKGKKHKQGGIPAVVNGGKTVELEGEEFITSARSTALLGASNLQAANDNPEDYAIVRKDVLANGGLIGVPGFKNGIVLPKKTGMPSFDDLMARRDSLSKPESILPTLDRPRSILSQDGVSLFDKYKDAPSVDPKTVDWDKFPKIKEKRGYEGGGLVDKKDALMAYYMGGKVKKKKKKRGY